MELPFQPRETALPAAKLALPVTSNVLSRIPADPQARQEQAAVGALMRQARVEAAGPSSGS